MTLDTNKFGARYDVKGLLGKGGMGEVYRAYDSRLQREVALKVLPEDLAQDDHRIGLFQREARVIASLNHPNISAIYELEDTPGLRWLVLELVDGVTLAERIAHSALSVAETLSIAKQIVDGLEGAHEKGVIHGDLKPANIKITSQDKVKLLDFGLATVFETDFRTSESGLLPTMSMPWGVEPQFGTASYMAPEQYQMKTINKQVDIWAFGCVLFEMLAGQRAFARATFRDTATAILESDPDWRLLGEAPPRLLGLLRRCLEKDRRARLHDIADARIELEQLIRGEPSESNTQRAEADTNAERRLPSRRQWLLTAAGAAGGVLLGRLLSRPSASSTPPELIHFPIPVTQTNSITQIAVSPSGRRIAFVAGNQKGDRVIWIRDLNDANPRPLEGTEESSGLFWSPDEQTLAFFNNEELHTIAADGRNLRTVGAAPGATSGSWSRSGAVLIDSPEGRGLYRVSLGNGTRSAITSPDIKKGERHFQPQFLPDGRRFLFLVKSINPGASGIFLGSLDTTGSQFILNAPSKAMFADPSRLFFVRDGVLLTQEIRFDPIQLIGQAVRIADHVSTSAVTGSAAYSVSANGVVAFRSGSSFQNSRLAWLDRSGNQVGEVAEPGVYPQFTVAPDGKHAALERRHPDTGAHDIWIVDLQRNATTPLTFDPGSQRHPVWLPDNRHVIYTSDRFGETAIFRQNIDKPGEEQPFLKAGGAYRPMHAFRNTLLLQTEGMKFHTYTLDGSAEPQLWLESKFPKSGARLSPDGKLVAFNSTDTDRNQVYVVSFPAKDSKVPISTNGGVQPMWSGNGAELFYIDLDGQLMSVRVRPGPEFGNPVPLFPVNITVVTGVSQYAVNYSGTQFLFIKPVPVDQPTPIDVIVNWR